MMSATTTFAQGRTYRNAQPSVFNTPSSSIRKIDEPSTVRMGPPRRSHLTMDELSRQAHQITSTQDEAELRQGGMAGSSRGQQRDVPAGPVDASMSSPTHRSTGLQRHRSATTMSEPSHSASARLAQMESYDDISSRLGVDPQLDWIVQLISDSTSDTSSAPQAAPSMPAIGPSSLQSDLQRDSSGQSMSEHTSHGNFREGQDAFASQSPVTPTDAHFMSYSASHDMSSFPAHAASGLPASPSIARTNTGSSMDGLVNKPAAHYPTRPLSTFIRRATMSTTPQQAHRDARASASSMTSFRLRTEESREIAPACDFCRRRKVKCDRQQPQCTFCIKHGILCTQNDQLRKRGPPTKDQRIALERAGLRYDRSRRKLMPMSASSPCLSRSSQSSASSTSFSENAVAGPSVLSGANPAFLDPSRAILIPSPTSPLATFQEQQQWTSQHAPIGAKPGMSQRPAYTNMPQRSPRYSPYQFDGMPLYTGALNALSEEQRERHDAGTQMPPVPSQYTAPPLLSPQHRTHDWHDPSRMPMMQPHSPRRRGLAPPDPISPFDDRFHFAAQPQATQTQTHMPQPPMPMPSSSQQQDAPLLHPHYRSPKKEPGPSQSSSSHSPNLPSAPQHWSSS